MKKINKIFSLLILLISIFTLSLYSNNIVNGETNNYYASINSNIKGVELKLELRDLITRTHTYETTYNDCRYNNKINGKDFINPDQDPNNPNNIILFWSGISIPCVWDNGVTWNREHVWPKSHSWFYTSEAGSDLHHIRPVDSRVNSTHNNHPYGIVENGEYVSTGPNTGNVQTMCKYGKEIFEPCDNRKGDVARIVFYLLTRYPEADSYQVNSSNVATSMDLLLDWNKFDPVDSSEIWRNDAVESIQGNRNPFIDNESYADLIWDKNAKPQTSYKVNLNYNQNECNVNLTGTKQGSGYIGDVLINVEVKEGYELVNISEDNNILSITPNYTINNINKDHNIKVNTKKIEIIPPTPPIIPSTDGSFKLVTDITNLKVGDEIIIVGSKDKNNFAMSIEQNKNNRGQTPVTIVNNEIKKDNKMQVITLGKGIVDNTFSFKIIDGDITNYLYAASSSSNNLKTTSNLDNNGSWLINSVNDEISIVSQGTNSRNQLKYNSSSNLFSCYGEGNSQKPVQIFKKVDLLQDALTKFTSLNTLTSMIINYHKLDNDYVMDSASIRFGTTIEKSLYDTLNTQNTKWGVEVYKGDGGNFDTSNITSIECLPVRVSEINGTIEDSNGSYYQFALVLTNMHYIDIDTFATARVYVEINNTRYYMNEATYSLRSLVNKYLTLSDQSAFINHLGILNHIKNYN